MKKLLSILTLCFIALTTFSAEINTDANLYNDEFWNLVYDQEYKTYWERIHSNRPISVDVTADITIKDKFVVPDNTTVIIWGDADGNMNCTDGITIGRNSRIIIVTDDDIYKVESGKNEELSYYSFQDMKQKKKDDHHDYKGDKWWKDKFEELRKAIKEHKDDWKNWVAATEEEIAEISSFLPVEIDSFNASVNEDELVVIWSTASELNNDMFYVEVSTDGILFNQVTFVSGHGTTSVRSTYTIRIPNTYTDSLIYIRLKQVDFDGNYGYSETISVKNQKKYSDKLYFQNGSIMYKGERLRL